MKRITPNIININIITMNLNLFVRLITSNDYAEININFKILKLANIYIFI